jgi:hypothetical protein
MTDTVLSRGGRGTGIGHPRSWRTAAGGVVENPGSMNGSVPVGSPVHNPVEDPLAVDDPLAYGAVDNLWVEKVVGRSSTAIDHDRRSDRGQVGRGIFEAWHNTSP